MNDIQTDNYQINIRKKNI